MGIEKKEINAFISDVIENIGVKKENYNYIWWQPALLMFVRFSVWIIFPVLIAFFFGKWFDSKYNSEPLFFLIIIGASFPVSIFGLIKNVNKEYKKIERESSKKKKHDTNRSPNGINKK